MKRDEPMSKQEFGQLVAFLRRQRPRGKEAGQWQQEIETRIGEGAAKRTRQQVVDELRSWLRALPKG